MDFVMKGSRQSLSNIVTGVSCLLLWLCPGRMQAATIIDLGSAFSGPTLGVDINNEGEVVGRYLSGATAASDTYTFVYLNGVTTVLGGFGGNYSDPTAINDSGQIVGLAGNTVTGPIYGFLYSNGMVTNLDQLTGLSLDPYDINDLGQIVGEYDTTATRNAFLYSNGAVTNPGSLIPGGYENVATGINDSGQVVGSSQVDPSDDHAFLYSNGTLADLGTLGGPYSYASAINNSGEVTGYSGLADDNTDYFIYSNGTMTDLGAFIAAAINDNGQIVGYEPTPAGTPYLALYADGIVTDIESMLPADSGWSDLSASGINDADQITGTGIIDGQSQAFLLDLGPATSTPEPGSIFLAALAIGAGALVMTRQHVRKEFE